MLRSHSVVLLDFGIARVISEPASSSALDAAMTRTGTQMGTPLYMAPEMWTDASVANERADIYSLGVIAFELWTGRPPFGGDVAEIRQGHTTRRPPAPSTLAAVPGGFDAIIKRCLRKDPLQRYPSVEELRSDLNAMGETAANQTTDRAARSAERQGPRDQVVLAVLSKTPLAALTTLATTHGAVLARANQQGPIVFAFPNPDLRAATGSAQRFVASIANVSGWHLDVLPIVIRTSPRGVRVLSDDLDAIEVKSEPTTSERAQTYLAQTTVSLQPANTEIIGRDVDAIVSALIDKRGATVVGASGLGKTRLATAVAHLLRMRGVSCAYLRARSSGRANPDALIADVLRIGFRSEEAIDEAFTSDESGPRWAARSSARLPQSATMSFSPLQELVVEH